MRVFDVWFNGDVVIFVLKKKKWFLGFEIRNNLKKESEVILSEVVFVF